MSRRKTSKEKIEGRWCPPPVNTISIQVEKFVGEKHCGTQPTWSFKFTSWLNTSPVTDTQSAVEDQILFAQTLSVGKVKLVLWTRCTGMVQSKAWTTWQLIFELWSEKSVFVLDELETNLVLAYLSKCSHSNQTGLVRRNCKCRRFVVFHLYFKFLRKSWHRYFSYQVR